MDKFQDSSRSMFDSAKSAVDSYIRERPSNTEASLAYKTITGVLSASTKILHPVVEVIVILIPEIFKMLFGSFQERSADERLRNNIAGRIPAIKRQLRGKVVEILRENSGAAISEICKKFDDELQSKKQEIEKAQQDSAANAAEISAQIEKCSSGIKKLDELLAKVKG